VANRSKFTDRARATFIETLAETCNVSEAARRAGIARRTVYEWKDADPEFAADWLDAEETAADKLELEARRRAVEGVDKPITFQGAVTGTYKEYSDKMLEILLKAHRPDKFVERNKVDVTVSGLSEAMRAAEKRISDGE
jgi:transposase